MANIDLYIQKLVAIANAIREQLQETDEYTLDEMPEKILSISGGGESSDIIVAYVPSVYARNCEVVINPIITDYFGLSGDSLVVSPEIPVSNTWEQLVE